MRDQPRIRHAAARPGYTLIEMVGTLSVLLAIGVAAVSILGAVAEIGVRTSDDRRGRISVQRLATTLRDDVHAAADIELSKDESRLTMTTGGSTIEYQWQQSPPAVLRRVVRSDAKTAHELFALPSDCRPNASLDGDRVSVRLNGDKFAGRWVIEAGRP